MAHSIQTNIPPIKFSACLFDLDGTLLDTAPEFAYCMNLLLKRYHRPLVCASDFRNAISKGALAMVQHCFGFESNDPALKQTTEEFLTLYKNILGQHSQFFPGIESLLHILDQKKIAWGIVTNKASRYTLPLINKFPLLQKAGCIVAGDTLPQQKPHAEPIIHALKQIKAQPHLTLFVGDAHSDILAGQAAGLKCIVASYGYIHPTEDVYLWKADYYIDHADQLMGYLV